MKLDKIGLGRKLHEELRKADHTFFTVNSRDRRKMIISSRELSKIFEMQSQNQNMKSIIIKNQKLGKSAVLRKKSILHSFAAMISSYLKHSA